MAPDRDRSADPVPDVDPFRAAADEWYRDAKLRDGTKVLIRQLRPSDRARLEAGMAELSAASRYLRFHANVTELSEEQLDYLTLVDHVDHEALVALDLAHRDRPGIGVARYIREPYEHEVAEAAITVIDAYHGQGAGTILLGALAARARDNGVRVFRNYVLEGNHAMLEVFDHLGARRHWQEASGLWCVDLDVPTTDGEALPDSAAGRAFLQAAQGERGGRLVQLFPPVWDLVTRLRHRSGDSPSVELAPNAGTDPDATDATDATDDPDPTDDPDTLLAEAFLDHGLDQPRRRRDRR